MAGMQIYGFLLRAKNAIQGQSHLAATTHTIYMRDPHTRKNGALHSHTAAGSNVGSRQSAVVSGGT